MRLILGGVGRLKAGPERELVERYLTRIRGLSRGAGISRVDTFEVEEGSGRSAEERKRSEAGALQARLPPGPAVLIVFDEHGETLSSLSFAARIRKAREDAAPALALVIGGPDGLDETFRKTADLSFAFGAATLPHQLVRVLAAEQVYRALTIMSGHPYHRA